MEWVLELVLIVLLAATLFHAVRLERALGVLKRERATLEQLIASFTGSAQQAEQGVERLRSAADGAGRLVAHQIDAAGALKDDLVFLTERGVRLADRLEALVRMARPLAPEPTPGFAMEAAPDFPPPAAQTLAAPQPNAYASLFAAASQHDDPDEPRLRSKAERDLAKALKMVR